MDIPLATNWKLRLEEYLSTDLLNYLSDEYKKETVYPQQENIFNALNHTSFEEVKVVIIGQDPYHNPGQAHGLSFSVPKGIALPPSLKNIYTEIESDLGIKKDYESGDLSGWADQGVLLLNAVLTVRENMPGSHQNKGWEVFTDEIIKQISEGKENCVFLLWGNYAKKKGRHIDRNKHLVLESAHPSPLSSYRGFFGNKHFSQANEYLESKGKNPIHW